MILKLFRTPDAKTIACRNLEQAKRDLLYAQSTAEHATKMVEYYEGLISRLTNYVSTPQ